MVEVKIFPDDTGRDPGRKVIAETTDAATTGTDVIRQVLQNRNRKFNLSGYARDAGIPLNQLNDFLDGKTVPSPEQLQALTREIYGGHAVLDLERNLLKSANTAEAKSIGVRPEPYDPATHPYAHACHLGQQEFRPFPPSAAPKPKPKRPGWVD